MHPLKQLLILLKFAMSILPLLVAETTPVIPLLAHVSIQSIVPTTLKVIRITDHNYSAPLAQGGKSDEQLAAHCLKIPGSYLNLSVLLDKKKFRTYGHKPGALRGFTVLKEDEMGTLEHCGGRGANKVSNCDVTDLTNKQNLIVLACTYVHSCITSRKDLFLLMMTLKVE